ncbi:MAG: DoxX family protein [Muribaculaceae bacterium]|nr:DoxX family protein [Muribaculaceae bacterium]
MNSITIKLITWFARILCGGLFIYSGFVKAIDTWGTIFKVEDYLAAFGLDVPFALIRMGVFGLCAIEFIVGIFLLIGCFRKSCPIFALLIMMFMLPLTLWVAMEEPVADCGCFGDAWHISNWWTFWKNVVLTLGILWLIRFNTKVLCLVIPAFQWLTVVASGLFILVIELFGYFYQPLIDFRDYPEGSKLFATIDSDDEHGIDVFDIDSADDRNEEAMDTVGKQLVVMIPNVKMISPATTWKLNSLYEWAQDNGVKMIGIVSGSQEEIEEWEDLSMTDYPLYLADDTAIKEVVRGNPGIVYLDKGKIVWKTTLSSIDIDDFLGPDVSRDASTFGGDNDAILRSCIFVYLIVEAFLIFISFTPRMARLLTRGGLASTRGIRHH